MCHPVRTGAGSASPPARVVDDDADAAHDRLHGQRMVVAAMAKWVSVPHRDQSGRFPARAGQPLPPGCDSATSRWRAAALFGWIKSEISIHCLCRPTPTGLAGIAVHRADQFSGAGGDRWPACVHSHWSQSEQLRDLATFLNIQAWDSHSSSLWDGTSSCAGATSFRCDAMSQPVRVHTELVDQLVAVSRRPGSARFAGYDGLFKCYDDPLA